MKDKIRHLALQLFATHIGRILVGIVLCLVGGILSPNGTIGELLYDYDQGVFWTWMFYIGTALWTGEALLLITYGLIINPIKGLINKLKK
jgi:hypothetical protein